MFDAAAALDRAGELIGSGSSRDARLINGVIYKTINGEGRYAYTGANSDEWANYCRLMSLAMREDIRVARTMLYTVNGAEVIAMEYVTGAYTGKCYCTMSEECEESCLPDDIREYIEQHLGIGDLSYGNIVKTDSEYVLIDFAC